MSARIRKLVIQVDETHLEMGRTIDPPTRRALAMAVIENPYAGRYVEQLDELVSIGEELGDLLGRRCVAALGIEPGKAESYGKAAIVGEAGELEHAAAILHPKLGAPLRAAVVKGAALVPSSKKRGGPGTAIDVPLGHKDAAYVRSHFDAIEARIGDAPFGQRDSGGRRRDRQWPPPAPNRRSEGGRCKGRGWIALIQSRHPSAERRTGSPRLPATAGAWRKAMTIKIE